jgi:hypothetical protein
VGERISPRRKRGIGIHLALYGLFNCFSAGSKGPSGKRVFHIDILGSDCYKIASLLYISIDVLVVRRTGCGFAGEIFGMSSEQSDAVMKIRLF